jgi:multicomponent Na+:H+ antiporter subunit A
MVRAAGASMASTGKLDESRGESWSVLWVALPWIACAALVWGLSSHALPWAFERPWLPGLGPSLAFRVDGLSALFLLLISGVGAAVFVYAYGYLAGDARRPRILALLSLFMVAMVGCVTADDLLLLFLFWEATSLLSYLLVGTNHEQEACRKSATQALVVTGGGGLCLFAGLLLLWQIAGTTSLSQIVSRGGEFTEHAAFPWAFGLVLLGCATKSAQFPFHFWLPNAMVAPTPISAYLHSATLVKLGVYLLARLGAGFGDWEPWSLVLVPLGAVTASLATLLSLMERDLKRIFAWSTIGALGTLVMLIGLGRGAELAAATFLLAHALYKAPLFFVAGNLDQAAGTRRIDLLGGLRQRMPWTAAAAALAGMSMAGLPFSLGFVAKEGIQSAKGDADVTRFLLAIAQSNRAVAAVSVAVAAVAAVRIFWWHPGVNEKLDAREVRVSMFAPPLALAVIALCFGIAPGVVAPLLIAAAGAISGGASMPELDPELLPMLGTLAVTWTLGGAIFWAWDPIHAALARLPLSGRQGFTLLYGWTLERLAWVAARTTGALQHGRLPGYMALNVLAATALLAILVGLAWPWNLPEFGWPGLMPAGGACVAAAGALVACTARDRLLLVLASGMVGYGSAIVFLACGAPDLALTQFVVETVLVIVVAAVLMRLRADGRAASIREPRLRPLAALLGAGFGVALGLLFLCVAGSPFDSALGDYYARAALPEGHGRNVVNVVLVDFRGLDTLGEIAVVAFSLLAAAPLLAAVRGLTPARSTSSTLTVFARPLHVAVLAAAAWFLLRGHDQPGGGFIGGLIAVSGSVTLALALSSDLAARHMPLGNPRSCALFGVALALVSGLPALARGEAFLTHTWHEFELGFTRLPVSTVYLFDLGVLLAVWGALAGHALVLQGSEAEPQA